MKNINATYSPPNVHWVGNGFPVRSLFSYDQMGAKNISPFLLLDYAGPAAFAPGEKRRGVGQHPHRGFETVTLVYQGEVEHRDSTDSGGVIGEGDVQWMTAGAGIVHDEFHSPAFTHRGGRLEMVQLWVNLPAADKSTPASYQTLLDGDIPSVPLDKSNSRLRVIAGDYLGHTGPARTFSPINVWDLKLESGCETSIELPEKHTALLVGLSGTVEVNGSEVIRDADLVCFERDGTTIQLCANNQAHVLILTGEPIDEPVVGYGPFVMNSKAQIKQAMADFQQGKFGTLNG
ncbi:pirin family protein [Marinobacter sp. 1Y8]